MAMAAIAFQPSCGPSSFESQQTQLKSGDLDDAAMGTSESENSTESLRDGSNGSEVDQASDGPRAPVVGAPPDRADSEEQHGEPQAPVDVETQKSGVKLYAASALDLNKQLAVAKAGDEVVVSDGTYQNFEINIKISGESLERPIFVSAQTPGKVVLKGRSQFVISGSYVVLKGFRFTDIGMSKESQAIVIFRGHHNRVQSFQFENIFRSAGAEGNADISVVDFDGNLADDNRLHDSTFKGIKSKCIRISANSVDKPERNRIDHNRFSGFWVPSGALLNGWELIQVGLGQPSRNHSLKTLIEYNEFYDGVADPELISVKSSDNIIRNNLFQDVPRNNITLRQGRNNLIENNRFIRTSGIEVFGTGHVIAGNSFASGEGIKLMAGDSLQAGGYYGSSEIGIPVSKDTVSESRIYPAASYTKVLNNSFEKVGKPLEIDMDRGWNTPQNPAQLGIENLID